MPKLTDRLLAGLTLSEGQKDRLLFDTACPGLAVRLTAKGTRAFVAQWTDPATRRKVREPLGVWGSITIEQAREATRAKLGLVAKGINPRAERFHERDEDERQRAERALSFDALLSEWAALHLTTRRPRYASETQRAIRYAFPHLLKRPAARIARAEVVNTLDDLLRDGKRAMAGRTLAYARACFQWGVKRGKVPSNPFNDLPIPSGSTERDRVLSDPELHDIWIAAGTLGYPFGPFFRMLILTLQRREEVAGMRWSEIAADLSRWTIPAARMKNARPHDIHLVSAAREILQVVPRRARCDYVFSTTGATKISGISRAKDALDAAALRVRREGASPLSPVADWRLHDLRRTGVSILARLGIDSIVADKLLGHQPTKLRGVASVYQRHDFAKEKAQALEAWAVHVTRTDASPNVVDFKRPAI